MGPERCTCPMNSEIFFYPYKLCAYCLKKYGLAPEGPSESGRGNEQACSLKAGLARKDASRSPSVYPREALAMALLAVYHKGNEFPHPALLERLRHEATEILTLLAERPAGRPGER